MKEKEVCPNCKTTVRMQTIREGGPTVAGTGALAGLIMLAAVGVYHLYEVVIVANELEGALSGAVSVGTLVICVFILVAIVVHIAREVWTGP